MQHPHGARISSTVLAAAVLAACSNSGGGSNQGSLSLALMDAPVDGVQSINIEVDGVRLQPDSGQAIEFKFDTPKTVDLLSLTAENSASLLNAQTVPAGKYVWLELEVNDANSYAMDDAGQQQTLRIPSGSQSGLRLVSGFTVTADQQASFKIDWNARMGLTEPPGQGGYLLRPAFRLIDMQQYGTLSGTVQTSVTTASGCASDVNTGAGNAVYIYNALASGQTPDDIGGTGPQPVATAAVKQDANGNYTFQTILSPGDYTVAFACQASTDDPTVDDNIAFVSPSSGDDTMTITNGQTTTVDF